MAVRGTNRVAVYYSNRDIRLDSRSTPTLRPGEILLEVHASGICGSDLMEWYRQPRAPTVLGHEVAGSVALANSAGFAEGDRVVTTHHVPCLECRYCKRGHETACEMLRRTGFDPGGFADYVRIPAENVGRGTFTLPANVSDDAGSMVEPLGCVLRAQRKAGLGAGESVLIVGAGVSGSLHLLAAKAKQAAVVFVTDIQPARRAFATRLGADHALDAAADVAALVRAELGRGVDHAIVCTGAPPAVRTALAAVDQGGTVSFFAPMGPGECYPLPFNAVFWQHDVTLTSSYGSSPQDMQSALALIAKGGVEVERLVTHRLPLGDVPQGFDLMRRGGECMKIIIDPRLDASSQRH